MTIGLVLSKPPGYSEIFFNTKIKGLQKNRHKVILFTGPSEFTYSICEHRKQPKVYKFIVVQLLHMLFTYCLLLPYFKVVGKFVKLELRQGKSLNRILKNLYLNSKLLKFKGDWLHFGFATLALERELIAKSIETKMAISLRGYDINVYPLKHPGCFEKTWEQVDKVHSISDYLLQKAFGLGLPKFTNNQIIVPAVDFKKICILNKKKIKGPVKILTIARYNWIKGLDYLIEVANLMKRSNLTFEWSIIGSGNNEETERLLYMINEYDLKKEVVLYGKCTHSKTLNILSKTDIYVQTSINEGFCNAVLEAQANGVPVVAFDVGGLKENISNKKTGWLIKPFDCLLMAEMIIHISHMELIEREKIEDEGKKRVQNNFNLEKQNKAFQEFYTNYK